MFNPFTETIDGDNRGYRPSCPRPKEWRSGRAGEKLVLRASGMDLQHCRPHGLPTLRTREEVTQEVLVKVITQLSTFKAESKFRQHGLYRIVANHILNMKRRRVETQELNFCHVRRRHQQYARHGICPTRRACRSTCRCW